jgi:mono/diheme cytochrome c family protein
MVKKLITSLILLAFLYACSNTGGDIAQAAADGQSLGHKVYKTNCVTCHGSAGDMGVSGAANLAESELSLEERIQVITNGRNAMASFKSLLSPEKIEAVAEYTLQLKASNN